MDDTSRELERAILCILNGQNVNEGNAYIFDFIETEIAWSASAALFSSSNEHVRFFSANILYTKVKKHWNQLITSQQDDLFRLLMDSLLATSTSGVIAVGSQKIFINRIILALACICTRASGGINMFVKTAFDMIDSSFQSPSVLLAIEMLTILPSEVESSGVIKSMREESDDSLLTIVPQILSLSDAMCTTTPTNRDLSLLVMKLLRAWLQLGITLTSLYENHEASLRLICSSIQSGDREVVRESCCLLREIFVFKEYPRPSKRNDVITMIISHITASIPLLAPFFGIDGDEDTAYEICNFMVEICNTEVDLITSPNGCDVDFFNLLLSCVTLKPRKIASLTFDVWIAIQEQPVADRHVYLAEEIFYKLLSNLIDQSIYPTSFINWDDSYDDEDDFNEFRKLKQGIQEVLIVCYYVLQDSFFQPLHDKIISSGMTSLSSSVTSFNWIQVEVTLFILHAVMSAIKSTCSSTGRDLCLQFLYQTLQQILNIPIPIMNQYPYLENSICTLLGSLTFLLTSSDVTAPFHELFLPSLQFVFQAFNHSLSSVSASKAIHQLCIHGMDTLISSVIGSSEPPIGMLIDSTVNLLSQPMNLSNEGGYIQLIEALTRNIMNLPTSLTQVYIEKLASPLVRGLEISTRENVDSNQVCLWIGLISQLIRFSDRHVDDVKNPSHPTVVTSLLLPLLTSIWPHIRSIEEKYKHTSSSILDKIFELYGRMMNSAPDALLPQINLITHSIVTSVLEKNAATSALHCASEIITVLYNRDLSSGSELEVFLSQLLQYITQIFNSNIANNNYDNSGSLISSSSSSSSSKILDPLGIGIDMDKASNASSNNTTTLIWGYEPEAIEKYFTFIHIYAVFLPGILASSMCLSEIVYACVCSLSISNERGTIRAILQVIQCIFSPQSEKQIPYASTFLTAGSQFAQQILFQILSSYNVDSGGLSSSTLFPNITDTLYFIIVGSEETRGAECRQWMHAVLSIPSIMSKLTPEYKQRVFTHMFSFAISNKRRFKSLMQDVTKVCHSELPIEELSAYDDGY